MDQLINLLTSPIALYGLGAVALYFVYQQVAPRLKVRVPGGGLTPDALLGRLLGPRYADAKLEKAATREKKSGSHLAAGRMYEDAGKLQKAADTYAEGEEFYAAAGVLEKMGKGERAGELYLQAGDYKKAAQMFIEIGKPGRAAQLFLEKGNTLEAARLFSLDSQWDRAGDLYMKAGYPLRAGEAWEKHGEFRKAAEAFERHYSENVTYSTTYSATAASTDQKSALQAGRLYEKAGDLERAYQVYSKGSFFKDAASTLERLGQPAKAAELYMRAEDPDRAALAFEQAGDRVRAATLRGEVAIKADRVAEAAGFFRDGQDYLRSAELFESIGMLPDAAKSYEAGESWVAAGGVYIRAGLKERAAAAYERGNDYETAGKLYEEAGNGRKAIEMFGKAGLTFKSGEAAAKAGDRERAIAQLQRVGPSDENYRAATELLARQFIDSNLPALAIERLQKVLGSEPVSAANLDLYYWLGVAQEAGGNLPEAHAIYKKIQAEDLSYKDVQARVAGLPGSLEAPRATAPPAPAAGATPVAPPPGASLTAAPARAAAPQAAPGAPAVAPPPRPAAAPPAAAPASAPAAAGAGRPRFALLDELGGGPLGRVHRGQDLAEAKDVALRLLSPELLAIQGALQALTADLKAAAQVSHPALVRTLGFVDISGRRAIVTEWVVGRNFGEAIKAGHKLPANQVASLGRSLLQALAAIHAKGLVHGSIQPSNVMVAGGQVRVTDFGLGRVRQRFPAAYRAPSGGSSAADDLYSAAGVLYHLLTGQNPSGPGAARPASALVPGVPAGLDRALLRALDPTSSQRPASAEQFIEELQAQA